MAWKTTLTRIAALEEQWRSGRSSPARDQNGQDKIIQRTMRWREQDQEQKEAVAAERGEWGEEEWRCKRSSMASSQLPHRGVVATRRLREGPSPEDSERSARNARAAVCEVAKEQQARQQQGGHWNGFIHHITVHIGGKVNR